MATGYGNSGCYHQDSENSEETAEHFALRACYSATVDTISRDLTYFSNQFIEHAFITASAAGGIHTTHCTNETEKAAKLFTCVMATLTHLSSPERVKLFEIFLGIVSNQVAYCDLAVRITEKYVERNPAYSGPLRGLLEEPSDDVPKPKPASHPIATRESGANLDVPDSTESDMQDDNPLVEDIETADTDQDIPSKVVSALICCKRRMSSCHHSFCGFLLKCSPKRALILGAVLMFLCVIYGTIPFVAAATQPIEPPNTNDTYYTFTECNVEYMKSILWVAGALAILFCLLLLPCLLRCFPRHEDLCEECHCQSRIWSILIAGLWLALMTQYIILIVDLTGCVLRPMGIVLLVFLPPGCVMLLFFGIIIVIMAFSEGVTTPCI